MQLSGSNLKLDPEKNLLLAAPEPPIGKGSGVLMGRVFSENLTLFLETVTLTPWSFWTQNEPKMAMRRVFSFSKKHLTTNP